LPRAHGTPIDTLRSSGSFRTSHAQAHGKIFSSLSPPIRGAKNRRNRPGAPGRPSPPADTNARRQRALTNQAARCGLQRRGPAARRGPLELQGGPLLAPAGTSRPPPPWSTRRALFRAFGGPHLFSLAGRHCDTVIPPAGRNVPISSFMCEIDHSAGRTGNLWRTAVQLTRAAGHSHVAPLCET
jgi:hypothetical protein